MPYHRSVTSYAVFVFTVHLPLFRLIHHDITTSFVQINTRFLYFYSNRYSVAINEHKGLGYVVVYQSKKRQVYCEYEDDIRCDGTLVRHILPLCSLIGKANKQWRLKQCNNVAPTTRTSLLWIWEWVLKKCNDSDAEDDIVINVKYWQNNRAQSKTKRYSQPWF